MYYNLSFLFANEDFITVESLHKAIIGSIALRVLSCPSVNNGFVVRLLWLLRWAQQSQYSYLISYINLRSLQSMTLRSLAKKYFSCDITLESYFISLGIKIIDIKSMKCKSNSAALCTQNSEESCFKGGGVVIICELCSTPGIWISHTWHSSLYLINHERIMHFYPLSHFLDSPFDW